MSEPIINPLLVYLVFNIEKLTTGIGLFSFLSFLVAGAFLIWTLVYYENNEKHNLLLTLTSLMFTFFGTLFLIIHILMPTREALIGMIVANEITYERVEQIKDTAVDVKNELKKDIIEIIESINKQEVQNERD